ncbi:MAG: anti-sigma factor [Planctomycetes bacterium]|nr:anti-sigma factor [Planctomycetota bacterium]
MNDLTRKEQLYADAALGWLSHEDEIAFAALQRDPQGWVELAAWEQAAATPVLALTDVDEEPPPAELHALVGRLQAAAERHFATERPQPRPTPQPRPAPQPQAPIVPWHRRALPWLLAAACAALALRPWRTEPAPANEREQLLRSGQATLCAWRPGPSPMRGDVHGDVLWDADRQQGYLRLAGLPPLDPDHRYQLWIVDKRREGPPVDGGVLAPFARDGEVVIPVTPRLPVREAAAFVLTVEDKAGVVVSAQQHVVAIATP